MALSHTILAFLSEAPYSGYDFRKRSDEAVSCFWKASHQQIYRELARMEQISVGEVGSSSQTREAQ